MVRHHFTVDVEEYFHASALEPWVRRNEWDLLPSRVKASVLALLEVLERYGARATFFALGWVARRHPDLIRTIARAGHEIASHGWDHVRVTRLGPTQFRDSVRRAKGELESLSGSEVMGFRAPSYSIVPGREWALDVLIEEGYRYDSSLFPVRRSGYGYPDGPRDPYWLRRPAGDLVEMPPATLRLWGQNLPAGGGGYFRLLPYGLVRAAFKECERRGVPGTFYIHPWEIDPDQPRFSLPPLTTIRHYGGLRGTEDRLHRLLQEFRFTSIAETLAWRFDVVPNAPAARLPRSIVTSLA